MKITQNDRVLAALKQAGRSGITELDFEAPRVTDGGKPIRRLAARVFDLRLRGLPVEPDGERDGVTVYVLKSDENAQTAPTVETGQPQAADLETVRRRETDDGSEGPPTTGRPVCTAETLQLFDDTPAAPAPLSVYDRDAA
jgi:hypothetical protein